MSMPSFRLSRSMLSPFLAPTKLFDADLVEEDDSGAQALVGKKAKFFMVDFSWPMTLRPLSLLTRHISMLSPKCGWSF